MTMLSAANPASNNPASEVQNIRKILAAARPHLNYLNFGQHDNPAKREGKTLKWWSIGDLEEATDALTGAVALAGKNSEVTITPIEASLVRYGNDITLDEDLDSTSVIDLPPELIERIGANAGDSLDKITRNTVIAGTNYYVVNGKTTANITTDDVPSYNDIVKVATKLKENKAPKFNHPKYGPVYICLGSPRFMAHLLMDTKFQTISQAQASDRFFKGELAIIDGVAFCEADNASAATFNSVSCDRTMVFGRGAYGVASLPLMGSGPKKIYEATAYSEDSKYWNDSAVKDAFQVIITPPGNGNGGGSHGDRYAIQWIVSWKSMFVAKILNENFMYRVVSARQTW